MCTWLFISFDRFAPENDKKGRKKMTDGWGLSFSSPLMRQSFLSLSGDKTVAMRDTAAVCLFKDGLLEGGMEGKMEGRERGRERGKSRVASSRRDERDAE